MKLRFCLLFLAISLGIKMPLYTNMGSPYFQGTMSAQAFASQKVKVLNENLYILIADDFQTAQITAQYEIKTDSTGEGKFIPLLFV